MIVDLLSEYDFYGFIIKDENSSIEVINQIDGYCCQQGRQKGFFVPTYHLKSKFEDFKYYYIIKQHDLEKALFLSDLSEIFESPSSCFSNMEAWIHLRVRKDCKDEVLKFYRDFEGILTYPNSD